MTVRLCLGLVKSGPTGPLSSEIGALVDGLLVLATLAIVGGDWEYELGGKNVYGREDGGDIFICGRIGKRKHNGAVKGQGNEVNCWSRVPESVPQGSAREKKEEENERNKSTTREGQLASCRDYL